MRLRPSLSDLAGVHWSAQFFPPFAEGRISPGLPAVLLGGAYEILQNPGVGSAPA